MERLERAFPAETGRRGKVPLEERSEVVRGGAAARVRAPEDFEDLIDLGVAGEERLPREHFRHDGAHAPQVHGTGVEL